MDLLLNTLHQQKMQSSRPTGSATCPGHTLGLDLGTSELKALLLADVLQVVVHIGEDSKLGAVLGAARLAALGLGEPSAGRIASICRAPKPLHPLHSRPSAALERRLALYRSSYQALRPVFPNFTAGAPP